ncbi:hypothetical protein [Endomicrobium proavitum]|nr:hypothetical protein [Endomicrobium proavitum]
MEIFKKFKYLITSKRKLSAKSNLKIIRMEQDKWLFTLKKGLRNPHSLDNFEVLVLSSALDVCLDYLKNARKI